MVCGYGSCRAQVSFNVVVDLVASRSVELWDIEDHVRCEGVQETANIRVDDLGVLFWEKVA